MSQHSKEAFCCRSVEPGSFPLTIMLQRLDTCTTPRSRCSGTLMSKSAVSLFLCTQVSELIEELAVGGAAAPDVALDDGVVPRGCGRVLLHL